MHKDRAFDRKCKHLIDKNYMDSRAINACNTACKHAKLRPITAQVPPLHSVQNRLMSQQLPEQVQSDDYGFALDPLVPGQLMAQHYIRFKTMMAICAAPSPAGLPDLLMRIAHSAEFSSIKLRRSEKKPLNAINKGSSSSGGSSGSKDGKAHAVRFCVPDPHKPQKVKERISSGPEKIFIMVRQQLIDLGGGCMPASAWQNCPLLSSIFDLRNWSLFPSALDLLWLCSMRCHALTA